MIEPTPQRSSSVKDGDLATPMDLREFLTGVGTTMRLPPRTTVAMPVVREERVVARRRRSGLLLPLVAVISLGAWAAVALQPAPVAELPRELQGTWITDDPRYRGRSLMLGRNEITVVHPQGREVTVVREVEPRRRPDSLALVIRHGEVASIQTLSLALVGGTNEHLVLRNPEAVRWVRQVGGGGVPNAPAAASPPRAGESAPR